MSNKQDFQCPHCKKCFSGQRYLDQHLNNHAQCSLVQCSPEARRWLTRQQTTRTAHLTRGLWPFARNSGLPKTCPKFRAPLWAKSPKRTTRPKYRATCKNHLSTWTTQLKQSDIYITSHWINLMSFRPLSVATLTFHFVVKLQSPPQILGKLPTIM